MTETLPAVSRDDEATERSDPSEHLTQLGSHTDIPKTPEDALLEVIPFRDSRTVIRFTVPEFTSVCRKTGQPDFARIIIDYVPDEVIVESKSLKLFMHSFRNHGIFHEEVVSYIGCRLMDALDPRWLRVAAFFNPRGGIPIDVFWQSKSPPKYVFVPDFGVRTYAGR